MTLSIDPPLLTIPNHEPRPATVIVRAAENVKGTVTFEVPEGWNVLPATHSVELTAGGELVIPIEIAPPEETSSAAIVAAFDTGDGRRWSLDRRTIEYDHIPPQTVYVQAAIRAVHTDVRIRGSRVGYVMGSGDEIPAALAQIGYEVTPLDPGRLNGELSQYDAIVFGIRAFNTIETLAERMTPVLDYVKRGGVVVVQYNTQGRREETNVPAPWPFSISRDRVTVESAPVEWIDPDHPLLNAPNALTPADFDGWVQERGLYFPNEWDPKWQPVLSMADPGEDPTRGSLLYTEYGDGVFIYTGLSFFRQLPAGVPGAYRLFANLVSGGRE